jgi:hypothetical protein
MGEHQEKRVVIPPRLSEGSMNLEEPLHEVPRKLENLLPKFNLDRPGSPEDHAKNFFLDILLLNV